MENLIYCKGEIHFQTDKSKIAKKYCSQCETFICNSCALDDHTQHIDKVIKLNLLFNQSNEHEIMNKFLNLPLTNQIASSSNNSVPRSSVSSSTIKCMNFVFHEAKYYCKDCKGFLCEKCATSNGHNPNEHGLIIIQNYFAHIKEKIEFFNFVMTSGRPNIIMGDVRLESQKFLIEFQNIFEVEVLEKLFLCKENIYETIKKRNILLRNIYDEISSFFTCKQFLIISKKKELAEMQRIYEKIKFEKDFSKIYEHFILFENLIDSIISDDEKKRIKNLYDNLKILSDLVQEYNKIIKVKFEEEVIFKIKKIFTNFELMLEDNKINFKNFSLEFLKMNQDEYDRFMNDDSIQKEKINDFEFFETLSKFNSTNKIKSELNILSKTFEKNIKQEQSENHNEKEIIKKDKNQTIELHSCNQNFEIIQDSVKKIDEEETLLWEKTEEKNFFSSTNTQTRNIQNLKIASADVLEILAQPFLISSKEFMESEIVEIYVPENIRQDFIKSQNNYAIKLEQELVVEKEDVALAPQSQEEKRMTVDSEYTQFTNFDLKFKNLPISENVKISDQSDYDSEKEVEFISFENNTYTEDVKSEQIIDQINSEKKSNMDGNKINAMDNDRNSFSNHNHESCEINLISSKTILEIETPAQEVEEKVLLPLPTPTLTLKEKLQKINDISDLTWEERNKIEMISIGYNTHSTFIYNPLNNEVKEIEFSQFKFPAFHSFLNLLPWIYISGGKDYSSKDLNNFYKIRRNDIKSFELVELPQMNEKRSHHSMIYYKADNSIYVISGSKIKSCEKFSIDDNKWNIIPSLNHSREKSGLCIHNDEYLYVILGYDRTINKYVSNFERLKIKDNSSIWEVINVKGSQSLLKKQAMCCYQYSPTGIYLIGGVNALRNETKEILSYDFNSNTITAAKVSLNFNLSFNQIEMIELKDFDFEENILFNFSENFEVVKFNEKNLTFI
jgi:hypothetical protein